MILLFTFFFVFEWTRSGAHAAPLKEKVDNPVLDRMNQSNVSHWTHYSFYRTLF